MKRLLEEEMKIEPRYESPSVRMCEHRCAQGSLSVLLLVSSQVKRCGWDGFLHPASLLTTSQSPRLTHCFPLSQIRSRCPRGLRFSNCGLRHFGGLGNGKYQSIPHTVRKIFFCQTYIISTVCVRERDRERLLDRGVKCVFFTVHCGSKQMFEKHYFLSYSSLLF